jgi:hypothetical protein
MKRDRERARESVFACGVCICVLISVYNSISCALGGYILHDVCVCVCVCVCVV